MIALGGLTASRGEPVSGEIRDPKERQCSGILDSSFRGYVIERVRHAVQYALAARDSISRTLSGDWPRPIQNDIDEWHPRFQQQATCGAQPAPVQRASCRSAHERFV